MKTSVVRDRMRAWKVLNFADVLLLLLRVRGLDAYQRIQIQEYPSREQYAAECRKDYECGGPRRQESEGFDEKPEDEKDSRQLQPPLEGLRAEHHGFPFQNLALFRSATL